MEVVKPQWDSREYLGVNSMLQETVNQNSKDKKPKANMAAATLQAVLAGGRYPEVCMEVCCFVSGASREELPEEGQLL